MPPEPSDPLPAPPSEPSEASDAPKPSDAPTPPSEPSEASDAPTPDPLPAPPSEPSEASDAPKPSDAPAPPSEPSEASDAPKPSDAPAPPSEPSEASDAPPPDPAPTAPPTDESPAPANEPQASTPPNTLTPQARWTPPVTFGDRFSKFSDRLIQTLVVLAGLLITTSFFLWLVPSLVVSRSDAYALATQRAQSDRFLQQFLGRPLETEPLPLRYTLNPSGGEFLFLVKGFMGRAAVQATVKDGRVITFRPHLALDWTRPIAPQLATPRR